MAHHQPVSADPKEIARSTAIWHNFGQLLKYSVIGIAAALVCLVLLFIR